MSQKPNRTTRMTAGQRTRKHTHLNTLSLPEVRWQLTKPKDVPLKRKDTPTAPLFPEVTQTLNFKPPGSKKTPCFWLLNTLLARDIMAARYDVIKSYRLPYPTCSRGRSSHWLCSHGWCDPRALASQIQPAWCSRGTVLPPRGQHTTLQEMIRIWSQAPTVTDANPLNRPTVHHWGDTTRLWRGKWMQKLMHIYIFKNGELLVWSQCEYGCEGLLWYVLSILSPPEGSPESPTRRCHEGSKQSTHPGCVPNRSTSPTSAGCAVEASHLCPQSNRLHNKNGFSLSLKTFMSLPDNKRDCLPMFQVPTNTETMSGSLSWECLAFISCRSWQKASRFWKTWESLCELWGMETVDTSSQQSLLTRALSNVISRGVLWWLSTTKRTLAGLLWNLTIWRTDRQQPCQHRRTFMRRICK